MRHLGVSTASMTNQPIFHGGGGAGRRGLSDHFFVAVATIIGIVGVVALIAWFINLSASSAGSTLVQNPVPDARLSDSSIELARHFRPYAGVVPVLSYPKVDATSASSVLSPEEFELQMAMLEDAGFSTVSLEQVRSLVLGEKVVLPANPVMITFDGASPSLWTDVDPILASHGFTAVVFLTSSDFATPQDSDESIPAALNAMKSSSRWGFGSHFDATTLARPPGESLSVWESRVRSALVATSDLIDSALGVNVTAMSYPSSVGGVPTDDRAAATRLPELVGERYDLGFLDMSNSKVVSPLIDGTRAPRVPASRIVASPNALLGAIEEAIPRQPAGAVNSLRWTAMGEGECLYAEQILLISADGPTACLMESEERNTWDDIVVSGTLNGISSTTRAVVQLRVTASSRLEVSFEPDAVVVQRQTDGDWYKLDREPLSTSDELGPYPVLIQLRGTRLTIIVSGRAVVATDVGPDPVAGRLGIAAVGDQVDVVTMTDLVIAAPTGS